MTGGAWGDFTASIDQKVVAVFSGAAAEAVQLYSRNVSTGTLTEYSSTISAPGGSAVRVLKVTY